MNLIKSFNFKFFKENLKKSKGAVALLVLLVPIFTLLVTVLLLNEYNTNIPSKVSFSSINFIGMYIIPVIMSLVLFGYVYKKKSVDFINSQPINRKTIFVTNTIGGIILITIIQIMTSIVLLICGVVLPKLVVFPQMVLDIFIMMWVSYVFVFLVANLAMSVSGTFYTQIVVTMLILFLIPFCYDSFYRFEFGVNYQMNIKQDSCNQYLQTDKYYTMPYQMFHSLFSFNTEEFDYFSAKSISRMIILGVAYYFIGLHLFKKRKMENNEESFANEKIHILVKALTIFPIMILLNLAEAEKEFNIIVIAIIITYYFIYDFIIKRKIKLKTSLIYLAITLILLQGICSTSEKIQKSMPLPKLNTENIASVKIQSIYYNNRVDYYNSYVTKLGGYIENKDIIKLLMDSSVEKYMETSEETTDIQFDANTLDSNNFDPETKDIAINDMIKIDDSVNMNVAFKMKNGKMYTTNLKLYSKDFEKIKLALSKEEKFIKNIKDAFIHNGVSTINNNMFLEGEEKDIVSREIETKINTMNLDELLQNEYVNTETYICKYYYYNHKLQGVSIPAEITDEVLKIASKHTNKLSVEYIKNNLDRTYNYQVYNEKQNINGTGESKTYLYYSEDMTKFILENEYEEFDITKPYVVVDIETRYNLQFYTNKVEEVQNIVTKAQEYEKALEEKEILEKCGTIY